MPGTKNRQPITAEQINEAFMIAQRAMQMRLNQHGCGTFASRHEILGAVVEEYKELIDAVTHEIIDEVQNELVDIAVAAIFGVACIKADAVEW